MSIARRRGATRTRSTGLSANEWKWLFALTVFALLLRVAVVSAIGPRVGVFNDSIFYRAAAAGLAEKNTYGPFGFPTAQWPPGWPFTLSLLFRVTGESDYAGQLLNAAFGAATVALLYLLVRRLFGHPAGVVAAALWSVMPGALLWTDILVVETFYTFLLVGFFLLLTLLPRQTWVAPVLGLAVGLVTLTRGEGLLLLPVAVVALWATRQWRLNLGRAALVVASFALVLTPWVIRNYVVMDAFVPVSSNAALTLWSGHNPDATGGQVYPPSNWLDNVPASKKEIAGAKMLRGEAVKYLRTHPLREIELIPRKLLYLNRGDGYAMDWVNDPAAAPRPIRQSLDMPIRILADGSYYALLAVTVLAVALGTKAFWRQRPTRAILVFFLESLVLYGFLYYGNYRYRFPLEPLMLVLAAPLITGAWQLRRHLFLPALGRAQGPLPRPTSSVLAPDTDLPRVDHPLPSQALPAGLRTGTNGGQLDAAADRRSPLPTSPPKEPMQQSPGPPQ